MTMSSSRLEASPVIVQGLTPDEINGDDVEHVPEDMIATIQQPSAAWEGQEYTEWVSFEDLKDEYGTRLYYLRHTRPLRIFSKAAEELGEEPVKATGAIAFFGLSQYFDRVREPFVQLANAATEHLAKGSTELLPGLGNSISAGAMAAGIYTVSYIAIGEGGAYAARTFPETVQTFNESYPRLMNVAKHSIVGVIENPNQQGNIVKQKVKNFFNLGFQALSLGTVAQGMVTAIEGWRAKETSKLVAKTAAAGGALIVPIVVLLDGVVDQLVKHEEYDMAENVVDIVSSRWTWLGVGAVSVAASYKRNTKIAKAGEPNNMEEIAI